MSRLEAPDLPCPKCGQDDAFRTLEPHYREAVYNGGYGSYGTLAWPCHRCGFERITATADTVKWRPAPLRDTEAVR